MDQSVSENKSVNEFVKKPLEAVGEMTCDACGNVYKLYQTPIGPAGQCKRCSDKKLYEEIALPTIEQYYSKKEQRFIESFERVTEDLKSASVRSYKPAPNQDSQKDAKKAAIDLVRTFKDDPKQSLVLSGNCGTGKSHLSYAIIKALRDQGYKTLFIKMTHLLDCVRETYQTNARLSESHIFNMLRNLDMLCIDDLGAERTKKGDGGHETWTTEIIQKVLDDRIDKGLIVTTNYNNEALEEKYGHDGQRIISRMCQGAKVIRVWGDDQRLQRKH